MRRVLVLLVALLPTFVQADTVGLQFKAIKVPDLIESIASNIIRRDYVISPEVATNPALLNLSVKQIERSDVLQLLTQTLQNEGIAIQDRQGVDIIIR